MVTADKLKDYLQQRIAECEDFVGKNTWETAENEGELKAYEDVLNKLEEVKE